MAEQRHDATTGDAESDEQRIERRVRDLLADLDDQEDGVRERAADALDALGAASVPAIIAAYVEGMVAGTAAAGTVAGGARAGFGVPAWCITLLGRLHDPRASAPLLDALGDPALYPYRWLRRNLICAVGRCGAKEGAERLLGLLDGPDGWVHAEAILALKGAHFSRPLRRRAADALAVRLDDPDGGVRWHALFVLGWLRDRRAVAPLGRLLLAYPNDHATCRMIVETLGRVGGDDAIELLVGALGHHWWPVRLGAVEALGRVGDPRAVPPLEAFRRRNADPTNRGERVHAQAAARAIEKIERRHDVR